MGPYGHRQLQACSARSGTLGDETLPGWPFLQQLSQGANPSVSPQSCGLLILYLSCSSPEAPSPGGPPGPTGEREPSAAAEVAFGMRGHTQSVSPVDFRGTSWEFVVSSSWCICQGSILRVCRIQGDFPRSWWQRCFSASCPAACGKGPHPHAGLGTGLPVLQVFPCHEDWALPRIRGCQCAGFPSWLWEAGEASAEAGLQPWQTAPL